MDAVTIVYLIVAVLVGSGLAYVLLRRGDVTPDTLLASVKEAATVAQTLVQAAEQLSTTGQIAKDAKFNYVFSRLRELFPNLSEDALIAAIEGAVWAINQAVVIVDPPDAE